jgi:outer membrane lipoprotein-sorting protein
MRAVSRRLTLALLVVGCAQLAHAQTPDQIVEKHLAALGGRAALGKLKSRVMTGTITVSTPAGDITGPVELTAEEPNKSRMLIKLDLSAVGAGQMVFDQRFNGERGYVMDSMQGDRDIAGEQLETMRNNMFPTAFLNYKEQGATVELGAKEKVNDHDAYLVILKPKTGAPVRQYFDAESFLPVRVIVKINLPQIGEVEQTTDLSDFRDVDGVKVPFAIIASSAIQRSSITITKVEHNTKVDEALFSKPGGQD